MKTNFAKTAAILSNARHVLFITGAGVSAESGIPTFRGATAAFEDGLTEEGMPFEEVLSATTFRKNPQLSWKYFNLLEKSIRGKTPNAAHQGIAALETVERRVCVATQNIDGLHQMAGSKNVIELHGNLKRIICTRCDYTTHLEIFDGLSAIPRCPKCEAVLRPDIVLYEEMLSDQVLDALDRELTGFDMIFSVGTTSLFAYVTQPVRIAVERKIPVVEINPERTPISFLANFRFTGGAGETIQRLMAAC